MKPADTDRVSGKTPDAAVASYAYSTANRGKAAIKGVFWSGLNVLVPTTVSAIVFVVSSRILGPTEFGLVALATSIVAFTLAFAPGALGEVLVQQANLKQRHLDSVFWVCVGCGTAFYILLLLVFFSWPGDVFVDPQVRTLLPLLGLRLIFDLAATVPNALIIRSMSFHQMALRTISSSLISACLCIALLFAGYGIWALAISQLSISVVSFVVAFWSVNWRPGLNFSADAFRDVWRTGLFASGNRLLQMMSIDQMLIGFLAGPAALGIFNFARRLFSLINDLIGASFANVSHSLLSSLQSERDKAKEAFLLASFASAAASFGAFGGLGAIAGDVIPVVFGDNWVSAVQPVQAFCAMGLLSSIGLVQWALISSQGRNDRWFYYQAISQALTLVVVLAVADRGVFAITCAIAAKTFLVFPAAIMLSVQTLHIDVKRYLAQFVSPTVATLAMLAVLYLISPYLSEMAAWERIGTKILLGATCYLAVLLVLSRQRVRVLLELLVNRRKAAAA
ncbi:MULTISPECIES: oligosaccharide flippase family protein [Mesorhizobium]|uniref:oligosaccharide flippase family protein n=1 Tax=Mesorhizobium TaxID=68287 RepID=UPI0013148D06|nr:MULTISPECIES: oligosaccharide flippase family protein [Mesorhizobium]